MRFLLWLLKGCLVGMCSQWPGMSAATLLIATGTYFTWVEGVGSLAGLWPMHYDAGTVLSKTPNIDANATGARTFYRGMSFASLVVGIILGVVFLQSHFMALYGAASLWVNAFGFGIVLAVMVKSLEYLSKAGISGVLSLILGIFCYHSMMTLSPINVSWIWEELIDGAGVALSFFIPSLSSSLLQSLLGLGEPLQEGGGLGTWLACIAFVIGMVIAGIVVARCLLYLLVGYAGVSLAFMAGLMLGALPMLWPWASISDYLINAQGVKIPLVISYLTPSDYAATYDSSAHVFSTLMCTLSGFVITCLVGRHGLTRTE